MDILFWIIFVTLGSILLWLYWPSFNALLASDDARHRAYINTYISLLAATVCTFIASTIFGSGRRFQAVDVQNATLAGEVMSTGHCPAMNFSLDH